jgi:hypothetical protein
MDGVPSEVTVCRHKQRFGTEAHTAAYRELFERLIQEHFQEFPEELCQGGTGGANLRDVMGMNHRRCMGNRHF